MTQGPGVTDGLPAMHHYDERALTANEVYEELKKGIDCKSLGK
jgi:hypothetical protein